LKRLRSRWQVLDRHDKITLAAILALTGGAVAARAWLMIGYPPAFLGFPDSLGYTEAAALGIFRNTQHPAGYPLFLGLLHKLSDDLPFTITVQHAMGVATGLLLYVSVRRSGVPAWLGLVPAAVVFFGGTGLFLEHSLLSDPLLAFLQAAGIYFTIRALHDPALRWPLLAGASIGLSFWVRTVAISSAVLVPPLLLCATPGDTRRRLIGALTAALAVIVLIAAYVGVQDLVTGYVGYERESAWNLYGRVATFVNCKDFTPPPGTGFLCPREPLARRDTENHYQYALNSPAVKRFGFPYAAAPDANTLLERFSTAAIEHEPVAYARAILRGLGYYVFPRAGEGYTPQELRTAMLNPADSEAHHAEFASFYADSAGYSGSPSAVRPLSVYERYTQIQGPLLIILLAAALIGPWFLPERTRWAAAAFTLTALFSIAFAIAGDSYDARFAYATFGPLSAGAALGAWGITTFFLGRVRQLRWS
jgi:hypothetical protein